MHPYILALECVLKEQKENMNMTFKCSMHYIICKNLLLHFLMRKNVDVYYTYSMFNIDLKYLIHIQDYKILI